MAIERAPKRVLTKAASAARRGELTVIPEQHAEAVRRGANCLQCPLLDCGDGPVLGDVVRDAPIAFVGEAPGVREVETGAVFVGKSGQKLDECLERGGYDRNGVTVVNTLLCKPPIELQAYLFQLRRDHKIRTDRAVKAAGGRKKGQKLNLPPLVLPTEACYPRLQRDLDVSNSKVLVGVGAEGLRAVAKYTNTPYANAKAAEGQPRVASPKKQQGAPVPLKDGRVIIGTYHPAFAMRKGSRHFMPTIEQDLVRACDIARRGRIEWVEPKGLLDPSPDEAVNYLDMLRESGARVMGDIETDSANVHTARIRCVGMGALVDTPRGKEERAIVVPYRHTDGRRWSKWNDSDRSRVARANRRVFDEAKLAFQNGLFDTAVLLRLGLMRLRGKTWFDTMVAHHDTDHSELPHDLGFIASRFFEAPRWKDDADAKTVEHVSDDTLHRYNLRDVIGQLRLVQPLTQRIYECDTVDAFRTDTGLLTHARDMGVLGMVVDEPLRREFFGKLSKETNRLREELQKITGIPDFNPNSFKQVARFLYLEKGLTPPADPEAQKREAQADWIQVPGTWNPWEEDEEDEQSIDGLSTNEPTLMYLLDQGVDKQTERMIEAQLDYRSVAKLKGTYVGLKEDEIDGRPVIRDLFRERGIIIDHKEFAPSLGIDSLPIFHTSYAIHVVPGGRWASRPNVQNIPIEGLVNMRKMFIAAPGHKLVGADYGQIENRLYAIVSGDQILLDAYAKGMDVHSLNFAYMMAKGGNEAEVMKWYDRVYNAEKYDPVHGKELKKSSRKKAKIFVYLMTYGGQEDKLYKAMSIMRDPDGKRSFPDLQPGDIRLWWKNYHAAHPWLVKWQRGVVNAWRDAGYIATIIDGRKGFFIGGVDNTAMANFGIQGGAASVMNRGAKRVMDACPYQAWGPLSGPWAQVHDMLGLQVPIARQKEAEALLHEHLPFEYRGMKFPIDQASGDRMSEV